MLSNIMTMIFYTDVYHFQMQNFTLPSIILSSFSHIKIGLWNFNKSPSNNNIGSNLTIHAFIFCNPWLNFMGPKNLMSNFVAHFLTAIFGSELCRKCLQFLSKNFCTTLLKKLQQNMGMHTMDTIYKFQAHNFTYLSYVYVYQ